MTIQGTLYIKKYNTPFELIFKGTYRECLQRQDDYLKWGYEVKIIRNMRIKKV